MLFAPTAQPFTSERGPRGWRGMARRASRLAYRDYRRTRNLRDIIRANAYVAGLPTRKVTP